MQRQLFSASRPCPFGCRYCFAKFPSYRPQPEFSVATLRDDCSIIYPNCDGELLLDGEADKRLRELVHRLAQPTVVSFSTKGRLTERQVGMLAEVQSFLRDSCRGFLKVSISFSTISKIASVEPGTATLEQRLEGLDILKSHEIPRAVTIKPILPFVAEEEYRQLVRITHPFTNYYLLGDLYFDSSMPFPKQSLDSPAGLREISWLDEKPVWSVMENKTLKASLSSFICSVGALTFHSDAELVLAMWEKQGVAHGPWLD